MAGEPVTATTTPSNFHRDRKLTYEWSSTGGKVQPKEATASIDTTGLAPGTYTVTARVSDPKMKKGGTVSCTASFTVKEPPKHPPTITCSANPTTVKSGDAATITCQASSPDNRPLTYNWTSTGGKVAGTEATGTLDTAGAPAGPITVTTTVSDDRGLTASANTTVNVEVPPPPPTASKLNEIAFPNKAKPWRVDNTAKAILDDVALRLQREPDAKAVIIGMNDPKERGGTKLAAQRAVNTKAYLTREKGIDPSRIEARTGTGGGMRAEIWIVPAGATFNEPNTTVVNEGAVKAAPPEGRARPAKKPSGTAGAAAGTAAPKKPAPPKKP
jgi:outer membrane protein OmpA-like peptidoglycan-associated protein